MNEDESRYSVMMSKSEIKSVLSSLIASPEYRHSERVPIINRLRQRLLSIEAYERQQALDADYPGIDTGI